MLILSPTQTIPSSGNKKVILLQLQVLRVISMATEKVRWLSGHLAPIMGTLPAKYT